MKLLSCIALVCAPLLAAERAALSADDALKSFQLADPAMGVELVAAEPLVESPCAIAFDENGRLFVAENRGYPNTADPAQGRIALLVDADGDGRMDARTTFAHGLTFPNGVLPWQGGVIVTCAPDVLFLKDTDGDGVADERRVLLTGFATSGSTQLRVNDPTLGPDGWIYFAAGLSGGDITAPGSGRAAVKMTGDLRWHPTTGEIENVDGRSQYGMAFDDFGRRFICMNRVPVQHVVLQSRWLRRNPRLAFSDTVQDCNERTVRTGLKGGGDGVRLFPISANITTADSHAGSFSAACAITIWRGGAFTCDPTGNLIHADTLTPRGATFAAVPMFEGKEFLASTDDWFRPVFLASGPGGALYVADMYRKVIEHPDYLPAEIRKHTDFETGKSRGRIWRISGGSIPDKVTVAPRELTALQRAIELGNTPGDDVLQELVQTGTLGDRWMRAAVLSGIGGREMQFLKAVVTYGWDDDRALELIGEVARLIGRANANGDKRTGMITMLESVGYSIDELPRVRTAVDAVLARFIMIAGYSEGAGASLTELSKGGDLENLGRIAMRFAENGKIPLSYRLAGFSVITRLGFDEFGDFIYSLAADLESPTIRSTAIAALASFNDPKAVAKLLKLQIAEGTTPAQRALILDSLLANPAHLPALLAAVEDGRLPAAAIPAARRNAFLKHADPAIRDRAAKAFAASMPGDRQAAFEKAKAALALTADAAHGRELFKAQCATCHRLDREGSAVGPDLLDMRNQPKESILFHILVPDAEVAPAFAAVLAEANDGRSILGVLASETANSITLRGPLAQDTTLLRSDVKKLDALPNSLMPSGLEAAMSQQDLADLLAYLKGEK